jgi:hypothetical protein
MKKFLVALFALAVAVSAATAGVGIDWVAGWGVYDHSSASLTSDPAGAILDSYSVIWQLIYAGANNAIEPPDSSNVAGRYVSTEVGADDVVWAQRDVAQNGTSTYWGPTDTGAPRSATFNSFLVLQTGESLYSANWDTAGFVYQRVFEGTPTLGSWYFDTELHALDVTYVVGGTGASDGFAVDGVGQGSRGVQPDKVIPEPATMSLLGLGALAMVLRRKIRK